MTFQVSLGIEDLRWLVWLSRPEAKVETMKYVRRLTGWTLVASKEFVESEMAKRETE
jgi:ribosomal protein L7/L12